MPQKKHEAGIRAMRRFYKLHGLDDVVELIDWLLTSRDAVELISLGSSTIGLAEILDDASLTEDEKMAKAIFGVTKLHIGSHDGSVTPLQWLEELTHGLDTFSPKEQQWFNRFCRDLLMYSTAETEPPPPLN